MLKNYATPIICTILLGLCLYGMWLGINLALSGINVSAQMPTHEVYQLCQTARMTTDGLSEAACGLAQEQAQAEYLCQENNQDPENICWVERK